MFLWLIFGELSEVGKFVVPCVTHKNCLTEVQECIDCDNTYKHMDMIKVVQAGMLNLYNKGIEPHVGSWISSENLR
jgi:hypothetical protein